MPTRELIVRKILLDNRPDVDPRKLFYDERHDGLCVHCGDRPDTRDHIPSKVLLDDPLPQNLAIMESCSKCNNELSFDEAYVACLVDCAACGTTDGARLRKKVVGLFAKMPALKAKLDAARILVAGQPTWAVEHDRVARVVLKLARGHYRYLHAENRLEPPTAMSFAPLVTLSHKLRRGFEMPPSGEPLAGWPELGSRAFNAAAQGESFEGWDVVQPNRYRYLVSTIGGAMFRCVLSEYLACWVHWED